MNPPRSVTGSPSTSTTASTSSRRKSHKLGDKTNTPMEIILNDDLAERRSRASEVGNKRQSLAFEARDSLSRNGPSSLTAAEKTTPILANFEQWMKLVKDNKINASNSWNFALIDYFHDMSLLRDGDGINFQRASYTLDGCVKIYTSRVDSVASETGKLLSGLADAKKNRGGDEEGDEEGNGIEEDGEEEEEEESGKKKSKRRARAENTLAENYSQLEVKKLDLELTIDPLFRKMCADFDEGGAKGLLLNSLMIDKTGRVVFDGDANEEDVEEEEQVEDGDDIEKESSQDENQDKTLNPHFQGDTINIDLLKSRYFPDLNSLDELDICPSLPSIYDALNDPALLNSQLVKELQGMNINDMEKNDLKPFSESLDAMMLGGDGDDNDYGPDIGMDYDDGNLGLLDNEETNFQIANGGQEATSYTGVTSVNMMSGRDIDILTYFDETLKKNWAGPEHWKIQKLKEVTTGADSKAAKPVRKPKKVKEELVIDFLSEDLIDESVIFASGGPSINLPKSQRNGQNTNLLPDDRQFSSKKLIKLFSKPKANVLSNKLFSDVRSSSLSLQEESNEKDENFWANHYEQQQVNGGDDYNENFFNDDYGGDGDIMGDVDTHSLGLNADTEYKELPTQLLGGQRARPEYVNYAKSAKRVNVKLLKDNIWSVLKLPELPDVIEEPVEGEEEDDDNIDPSTGKPLQRKSIIPEEIQLSERKFTDLAKDLKSVYPVQQMQEISTSFCFICVLHLANEKGLIIEDNEEHSDLTIKWDPSVPRLPISV